MKYLIIVCAAVLALSGCGKCEVAEPAEQSVAPASNAVPAKSLGRQAIEGFTGKTAVDAGQRTKAKVADIGKKEKEKKDDINQVFGP